MNHLIIHLTEILQKQEELHRNHEMAKKRGSDGVSMLLEKMRKLREAEGQVYNYSYDKTRKSRQKQDACHLIDFHPNLESSPFPAIVHMLVTLNF